MQSSGAPPAPGRRRPVPPRQPPARRLALPAWLDGPMTSCQLVVGAAGMLLAIGLVMVFSASAIEAALDDQPAWRPGVDQVVFAAIGLGAALVAVRLPVGFLRRWALPGLVVAAVLLVLVLVPGIGLELNGSRAWIDLGFTTFQPSELAKLVFALWGAHVLAARERFLTVRTLLVPLLPVFAGLSFLLYREPDFGGIVSLGLVLAGLLWAGGLPLRYWAGFVAAGGAALYLMARSAPYRWERVTSFLDPFADPTNAGFQAVRGFYALATGGLWGVGLGNSAMKWNLLPEAESDYIFAIIGEELGFLGCLVVVGLYAVLAWAGFRIARRSSDRFVQLACVAITVWLVGQAALNMGYVVGLLPVTGLTLPLVSAGGTSLVLTLFIVGLLIRFARSEPEAVEHLRRADRGRLSRWVLPVPERAVDPAHPRRVRRPERPGRAGHPAPDGEPPAPRPAGPGARTVARVVPAPPGERAPRERLPARERRTADGRGRLPEARRQPPPRARASAPEQPRRPR
ncbi:putative lipid II flippase FtsW [Geodermatophilus sp. DSM 44513]|uniref:putative lipid II flippase FtsW n=1 Tax=Geodermatophilus sp. DSM 44513 TaxID=1528104 RepID=UPI0028F6DDB4|nr:putative lipid II flippase FtsW [Geodermatophilus sp. DSM 44513]WNV77352.1 putative lipid II flippase FtsW [Geodermatophilus sp. DSM 44513]